MIPVLHPSATRAPEPYSSGYLHAEALLRRGDYATGFPLYARTHTTLYWMHDLLPEWPGPHVPVKGKRILCVGEGGYGDNLYFLRWLDTLRRWGADVHFCSPPMLAPLARRQGFHTLENWAGNVDIDWPSYDYFTSLITLPAKLGVTTANYRWPGAYIRVDRPRFRKFSLRDRGLRIGLCWRAGEFSVEYRNRTLHDTQAEAFLSLPHRWVNLTHELVHPHMENPVFTNWLATANALATLDLVVTVDTGVAHLAGAMDVPSLVLLPIEPAWQYPDNVSMHPLYPSMRLVRAHDAKMQSAVDMAIDILETL